MKTVLSRLVAIENDPLGYINYVFELIDRKELELYSIKFLSCVRFPNWEQREIKLGDRGYLTFRNINAGSDTWFNGKETIPYKYNITQFIRFTKEQKSDYACL